MSQAFDESYSKLKQLASTDHNYVMRRDGAYEPEKQMFPVQKQEDASMSRSEMAQSPEVTSLDPMVGATGRPDPSYMTGRAELPLEEQKAMFEREAFQAVGAPLGFTTAVLLTLPDLISLPPLIATGMITAEEGKKFENVLNLLKNMPSVQVGEYLKEKGKELGFSDKQIEAFGEGYLGGELSSIVVNAVPGAKQLVKGAKWLKDSTVDYAAGAPARVAERGTGVTLQSGFDPLAAVDEAIVGLKGRAAKAPTDEEEGFIAFSGSPSDFNRFSLSKIGTGEGNQQFGHGLYFSDIEDIARFYRDALSNRQPISLDDLDTNAPAVLADINLQPGPVPNSGFLRQNDPDFEEYMQMIEQNSVKKVTSPISRGGFTDYEMQDGSVIRVSEGPDDALQETDPRMIVEALGEPTGKIYKVKINAIKNELVDQTKPLGKQPKKVMDALNDIGDNLTLDDALNLGFDPFELGEQQAMQQAKEMLLDPESDVLSFLSTMQSIKGSVNAGEKALSDRGIKGMRYLTGAARQRRPIKAEQNYVIFDDKIIEILEKYGIVGPVAVSSVAATQGEQTQGDAQ